MPAASHVLDRRDGERPRHIDRAARGRAHFRGAGAQKVLGWWGGPGFAGWTSGIARMGLRPALFWAAISSGVELVGGLILALGLFTPIASALLVAQSTYIVLRTHLPRGFWNSRGGIEFPLQLLAGSLLVVASGPGAIAIDPAFGLDFSVSWRAGSLVVAVVGSARRDGYRATATATAGPTPDAVTVEWLAMTRT